jgi:hypothetical protein
LNIEVETLDTLEGFDTATLPEGVAGSASALRLALSIAVEPPPVNLLPVEVMASRTTQSGRRIVAVGAAAAVILGAFLYGRARVTQISAHREETMPREASSLRSQHGTADASGETTETKSVGPTAHGAPPQPEAIDAAVPARHPTAALPKKPPATVVADRTVVPKLPTDPVVTGILVSDARRVARVDGQIVQVGDRLQDAVVQAIVPDAVVIAGSPGQTRRLKLERRGVGENTR